jgi:hypothetical protein
MTTAVNVEIQKHATEKLIALVTDTSGGEFFI